ncbi:MAG: DUF4147 domain-containing protein [Ectothiorhodospiraceae bacterium]|nr:DUF4147 domain-containing protein [Ectothiorhodospiraceae bacterium]
MTEQPRELLNALYSAALDAVAGRPAVRRALERSHMDSPTALMAIGKAAAAMTEGALDVLGGDVTEGLVVTKHDHLSAACRDNPRLHCLEASHPVPDASSLRAGRAVLDFLQRLPDEQPLLVLYSGGASSLMDVLPEGFVEDDLAEMNRWLLSQPLDIAQINRVRVAVSVIKGGRLAAHLRGRPCRVMLISDVPGDNPAVIGSGPLAPPSNPGEMPSGLPSGIRAMMAVAPPPPEPELFRNITLEVIANNRMAREAAAATARERGVAVQVHDGLVQGETPAAAEMISRSMLDGPVGVQVWGGETTVRLPPSPGRGGRAQALALQAALRLEGSGPAWLLCAGTDGTDGPGSDAGALVDHETCRRGRAGGLDPVECLRRADAGTFLEASGDLLQTGPTGTNVMDVFMAYRPGASSDQASGS